MNKQGYNYIKKKSWGVQVALQDSGWRHGEIGRMDDGGSISGIVKINFDIKENQRSDHLSEMQESEI